jgi:hypothetical protein
MLLYIILSISQAEQLSKIQLVDYFVIMVMAALWAFIPTDGIALVLNTITLTLFNIFIM